MDDAFHFIGFRRARSRHCRWEAFQYFEYVKQSFEFCCSKHEMHRSLFAEGIFQCQCAMQGRNPTQLIVRSVLG
jgi:hypothetical protein